jgi:Uma2 family endonuclease
MSLAIQLPLRKDQTEFNLRVWMRLLADPEPAKFLRGFETNRHGHAVMIPLPGYHDGGRQSEIGFQLRNRLDGNVRTKCPLSTADGVKVVDAVWLSYLRESTAIAGEVAGEMLIEAPEICVEVVSPSKTEVEMEERMALYFDAGAVEVWFCEKNGAMRFIGKDGPLERSLLCPDFPTMIEA